MARFPRLFIKPRVHNVRAEDFHPSSLVIKLNYSDVIYQSWPTALPTSTLFINTSSFLTLVGFVVGYNKIHFAVTIAPFSTDQTMNLAHSSYTGVSMET